MPSNVCIECDKESKIHEGDGGGGGGDEKAQARDEGERKTFPAREFGVVAGVCTNVLVLWLNTSTTQITAVTGDEEWGERRRKGKRRTTIICYMCVSYCTVRHCITQKFYPVFGWFGVYFCQRIQSSGEFSSVYTQF